MEIKCHKIRGVEKETCSAEQAIAYSFARMYGGFGHRIVNSNAPEFIKDGKFAEIEQWVMEGLDLEYSPRRLNFDGVLIAFRQGFRNFCEKPFIVTNYADIGKAFPIPYPVK